MDRGSTRPRGIQLWALVAVCIAGLLTMSACNGAKEIKIEPMTNTDCKFSPDELELERGEAVEFVSTFGIDATVTIMPGSDQVIVPANQTASYTIPQDAPAELQLKLSCDPSHGGPKLIIGP